MKSNYEILDGQWTDDLHYSCRIIIKYMTNNYDRFEPKLDQHIERYDDGKEIYVDVEWIGKDNNYKITLSIPQRNQYGYYERSINLFSKILTHKPTQEDKQKVINQYLNMRAIELRKKYTSF